VHAQNITNHQLKEKKNKHTSDTIVFGPMSLKKLNARKSVQLSEGFIIMQFLNTIWVPKLAHPTENNLNSSTPLFKSKYSG